MGRPKGVPCSPDGDGLRAKEFQVSDIDIPELPLETEVSVVSEEVTDESGGAAVYAFIGGGQGGGRLVESFYRLGYRKSLAVNTAKQDLSSLQLPEEQKLLLNAGEQGAGKDMRIGEKAAEAGQQELYDLMLRKLGKVDHVFVCVGAGGGSGGGSSLVLVETAKKYLRYIGLDDVDQRVGVIVALPTNGECASPAVSKNAHTLVTALCGLAEQKLLSPLIFVDNDKVQKLYPNLTVQKFWSTVNDTVAGLFHIFNVIPTKETPYTVFDAADYGSIMRAGGCMIMGVTNVKDPKASNSVGTAIKSNMERTLLADGFDLRTATHAAAVVLGGQRIFAETAGLMGAIEGGFDALAVVTGDAMVHRGIYEDSKDRLNVYTLVGGLSSPDKRIKSLLKFEPTKPSAKPVPSKPSAAPVVGPGFGNRLYGE